MDPVSSVHRHFLLFTAPLVGIIGAATGATALVGYAFAAAAFLALGFFRSRRALLGMRVSRSVYPNAFEDDGVRVELRVENHSRRRAQLVDIDDAFGPSLADRQRLLEPGPLLPGRRRTLGYRSFCSRGWGEFRVGPLGLSTSDALGLFQARRLFHQLDTFTVFPRVYDVTGLDRLGARSSLALQDATASRSGQSLAYLGVRDYRSGDDARRIHWPASARRGALAVKELEIDLLPYFTLFLDLSRQGRAGTGKKSTLEYVVRTAASLLWTAAARGDVVQMIAEGEQPLFVPPGRGELHATLALYEVVRARQDGKRALLDLVEENRAALPSGSTATLFHASLDFDLARLEETLEAFRSRGVRAVVFAIDEASFVPIDRRAATKQVAAERREAFLALLRERSVAGAVLSADMELGATLGRRDLVDAGLLS